jgi:hypothetical protein
MTQNETTTEIEYGDRFRHRITEKVVAVQDIRENSEKIVLQASGGHSAGYETKDELTRENSLWEEI